MASRLLLGAALLLLAPPIAQGQSSIERSVLGCGQGSVSAGPTRITDTIGQSTVRSGYSGTTTILSGFWPSTDFEFILDTHLGLGSLRIANVRGPAGHIYLTVLSIDLSNAVLAGPAAVGGWWQGLYITIPDFFTQISYGVPPFVGTLDSSGGSELQFGPGAFPFPAGFVVAGVTVTFPPGSSMISATSRAIALLY